MGERTILHSDLNGFYASVEMMLNPALRDKAVAVCGSTEDRHGIVLAKSEKARHAGVKTGMVNWQARQCCPDILFVLPQFEQYLKYSKLVREIYTRYTDLVEPFGMDECFLDVTGSISCYGDGMDIAQRIRHTVREETGLTVSIGVSFNKVFAKLGSDMKKPDAVTQITSDNFPDLVWPLPASDLLFVGRATKKKLAQHGIYTIGEIARADPRFLQRLFGINGLRLWRYAVGKDDAPVMHKDFVSPIKSIGHGITCVADLNDEREVWRVLLELAQDIGHKLRVHELKAGGVQISVRSTDFAFRQFQGVLTLCTQSPLVLAKKGLALFREGYRWQLPVRALTLRAIQLRPIHAPEQIDLFTDMQRVDRRNQLDDCVEDIRRRFGKRAVYPAALMGDLKLPGNYGHDLIIPGAIGR